MRFAGVSHAFELFALVAPLCDARMRFTGVTDVLEFGVLVASLSGSFRHFDGVSSFEDARVAFFATSTGGVPLRVVALHPKLCTFRSHRNEPLGQSNAHASRLHVSFRSSTP